jgi:hypothetical protein
VFGDEHLDTTVSINSLASVLSAQGKYAEAEPLFRKALQGCRRLFGEEHPNTQAVQQSLDALLAAQAAEQAADPGEGGSPSDEERSE